jgi:hypothetical protein
MFQNVLLDLLGDNDAGDILSPTTVTSMESTLNEKNNQNLLDLLGGLDTSSPAPTITPVMPTMLSSPMDLIDGGMGGLMGLSGGNNTLTTNNKSHMLIEETNNILGDLSFNNSTEVRVMKLQSFFISWCLISFAQCYISPTTFCKTFQETQKTVFLGIFASYLKSNDSTYFHYICPRNGPRIVGNYHFSQGRCKLFRAHF